METGRYLGAAAEAVGLTIEPEWEPGMTRFLEAAAAMAAILDRVELDDAELSLAPVFRLPDAPA